MRVFAIVVFLVVSACNKEISTAPAALERQVTVETSDFTPSSVTIRQGGKVIFVFQNVAHSIIFTEKEGRPDNIDTPLSNTTEERIFETVGAFTFYCNDHRSMLGTVTVEAVAATDPGA